MRIILYGPAGEVVLDLKGAMMADVERVSIEEGDHAIEARRYVLEEGSGLLHTITGAMPDVPTVHVLWGSQSLCKRGFPQQWPPDHTWVHIKMAVRQAATISCRECRLEAERIVRESKELLTPEQFLETFGANP